MVLSCMIFILHSGRLSSLWFYALPLFLPWFHVSLFGWLAWVNQLIELMLISLFNLSKLDGDGIRVCAV